MKFLQCLRLLLNRKISRKIIPKNIDETEPIVRCILHSYHYSISKGKIKPEAFLPPPNRNDVSTLRLQFTNADFCKRQGKSIKFGSHVYVGLAIFYASAVPSTCLESDFENAILAVLKSTPLDEDHQIRDEVDIYIDDRGIPMHADLIYNYTPQENIPVPNWVRRFAKSLSLKTKVFLDPSPESDYWNGEKLSLDSV